MNGIFDKASRDVRKRLICLELGKSSMITMLCTTKKFFNKYRLLMHLGLIKLKYLLTLIIVLTKIHTVAGSGSSKISC